MDSPYNLLLLEETLQITENLLQNFANSSEFVAQMQIAFGEAIEVTSLQIAWAERNFSTLPAIEVRSTTEIKGANGAYAAATNTIYMSQEFLHQNPNNIDLVVAVLLEGIGYAVDAQLKTSDTPGSEGKIFSALVRGDSLSPQQLQQFREEDTIAVVNLDGQALLLEQNQHPYPSFPGTPSLMDAANHPKFFDSLPLPQRIDATRGGKFTVEMRETQQWLGLVDTFGKPIPTTVWGYGVQGVKRPISKHQYPLSSVSYPGPTFVAQENVPIAVKWVNNLPKNKPGGHLLPVDKSIHLADPTRTIEKGLIPTVTHLHGGHTESASDGLPEAWFTQGWKEVGNQFVKQVYRYDNDQQAATLWYHDHTLGLTRLNVYAGLAGFYLLRDENELSLIENNVLPNGEDSLGGLYEREVVVQDRMFTSDGQLYYPSTTEEFYEPGEINENRVVVEDVTGSAPPPVPETNVLPEFFGDRILVNGTLWPELEVEEEKYRLRLLNGSDSRFYVFAIKDEATSELSDESFPFLQIGTDNGFLEKPVKLTQLTLAPGERADIVVNFDELQAIDPDHDGTFYLRNFGPDEPFGGGTPGIDFEPAAPQTTGQVMEFVVKDPNADPSNPDQSLFTINKNTHLNTIEPLTQTGPTRSLALFEGLDEFGRLQPLLGVAKETTDIEGNTVNGSLAWFEPVTENPVLGDTEVWEIWNATEDAHPIHVHLVSFQILDRQAFNTDLVTVEQRPQPQHDGSFGVGSELNFPESDVLIGDPMPPAPNEAGWKDTVIALPGEVTRIAMNFDRLGEYVWHCHILSHEDHEMMRPYEVVMTPVSLADIDKEFRVGVSDPLATALETPWSMEAI